MKISLPDTQGSLSEFSLRADPLPMAKLPPDASRIVIAAAHVVADPFTDQDPTGRATPDWDATMAFRRHLADLGLGIAEAMDTAQRGMGLDWPGALELIRRTRAELPDALVFNGCGTDQLDPLAARSLDDVKRAYDEQIAAIQKLDGRIVLMASRALAQVAKGSEDYSDVYAHALSQCDKPVILHWLGDMFDPALSGYWGNDDFGKCCTTVLDIIRTHPEKVDGIKISLLDKDKEIALRRQLPKTVKMYTGDDFNYPELIEGDDQGFSHALLGVFDPLATAAACAVGQLSAGDTAAYRATLDPTVALARQVFRAPTQYYKTGVVFLAWLNGFQDHFIMINGAQSQRSLPDYVALFKQADDCGVLLDPEMAVAKMRGLLTMYGV